ncbi:MAG: hypothetical protein J0H62_02125 [Rhizobiales bacterium]|nr:hypothetical protein [Hyphomicrobiales bacterium]
MLAVLGGFVASGPAFAASTPETRTFVVASTPDGYGVDQCLVTGARCGFVVANAYCQSHDFSRAASFRRMEDAEVTAAIPVVAGRTSEKATFVAIECAR